MMTGWSKSQNCCHICKTNYNRQSERTSKCKSLKAWWKNLDKEQRRDLYVVQKNAAVF